jgi:hypothetical protein
MRTGPLDLSHEVRSWGYPCRCLWRGLVQITITTPWRRMVLHFSQIFLTDGLTFMLLAIRFGRPCGAAYL